MIELPSWFKRKTNANNLIECDKFAQKRKKIFFFAGSVIFALACAKPCQRNDKKIQKIVTTSSLARFVALFAFVQTKIFYF